MPKHQELEDLSKHVQCHTQRLRNSEDLLDIYENDLLKFIDAYFRAIMADTTYFEVRARILPINVLIKIIDKLSKIYQGDGPTRTVQNGNDADQELLDFYIEAFDANVEFNQGNEFLNLDRYNLMQPFFDEINRKPALRAVPNDRFLVFSNNRINPLEPTHVMLNVGKATSLSKEDCAEGDIREVDLWWVWSAEEFFVMDSEGSLRRDQPEMQKNPEAKNPFSILQFQYFNSSKNFLIPPTDSDTKSMTVMIPAQLSQLAYAASFQAFSQIVAFNWDKANPIFAPNAVHFVNDSDDEKKARMEVIKPEVDITEVTQFVVTQLALWLETRGIKPGSIGKIDGSNMANGISKIIDEMDTAELRQKQADVYSRGERPFWDKVLKHMHPVWIAEGKVANRHLFSPNAFVKTEFPIQQVIISRKDVVDQVTAEMNAGLKSRETSIRELNPNWSDERIKEELELIDGSTQDTEEGQTTEETKAHTHAYSGGQTPTSRDLGNNQHDHGDDWSSAPFGAGHTHKNIETGEESGPPQ